MLSKIIFILVSVFLVSSWAQPSNSTYLYNLLKFIPYWENRINPKPGCFCYNGVPCNDWDGSDGQYSIEGGHSTDNYTVYIPGVGSFGPKLVALEYGRVILNTDGTDCGSPFVLRYQALGNSTISWPSTYCVSSGSILNLTINYTDFGGPILVLDGLFVQSTICFDPTYAPQPMVNEYISIPDEVQLEGLAANAAAVNVSSVCALIQSTCTGNLTQYTSEQDCINYMNTKPTTYGVCPTSQDEDTVNCRFLHALVAVLPTIGPGQPLPAVTHCPHTGKNSTTCINRCLPACANCTANQHCINTGSDPANPVYGCVCNTGYNTTANGSCVPLKCSANYQCYSQENSNNPAIAVCNAQSGLCNCTPTFSWNPATGKCYCPPGYNISWVNGTNPQCIPVGRCFAPYECTDPAQDGFVKGGVYNTVQCVQYGTNKYAPFNTCICNPGFSGGYAYPCVCLKEGTLNVTIPSTYSSRYGANLCLQAGQCGDSYGCPWPQTCVFTGSNPIGTCQ